ncbi:hypothetical protein [Guptibacillus algicola]|uniref:hypothetical protein n=1 Tax=Guptibacillus algicola TaxID=225844 RepID=UPI001CD5A5E2|nr:hypothetical protein [Alkalihalobacillus algicola]MCA0986573.1 hypothetical protein [Alkalihalobacillus algicola]
MSKQTKLVDCGSKIFVYDYQSRKNVRDFAFETRVGEKEITNLKRMMFTNFGDDNMLLANFVLKLPLSGLNNINDRLEGFIKQLQKVSGDSAIKYLAVVELPTSQNETDAYINLITDIEIFELAQSDELAANHNEDYFEEFFRELWGSEVFINSHSPDELVDIFIRTYQDSLISYYYQYSPFLIFHNKLSKPKILFDEDAETHIITKNLLSYPNLHTEEIYDNKAGFVIVNIYSKQSKSYPVELDLNWF